MQIETWCVIISTIALFLVICLGIYHLKTGNLPLHNDDEFWSVMEHARTKERIVISRQGYSYIDKIFEGYKDIYFGTKYHCTLFNEKRVTLKTELF